MLRAGGMSAMSRIAQEEDRRKPVGASASSDVWSLGCLLFELLTGTFLFDPSEEKWAESYVRAITDHAPVLTSEAVAALIPTGASNVRLLSALLALLRMILVRNPTRRPLITPILARIDAVLETCS